MLAHVCWSRGRRRLRCPAPRWQGGIRSGRRAVRSSAFRVDARARSSGARCFRAVGSSPRVGSQRPDGNVRAHDGPLRDACSRPRTRRARPQAHPRVKRHGASAIAGSAPVRLVAGEPELPDLLLPARRCAQRSPAPNRRDPSLPQSRRRAPLRRSRQRDACTRGIPTCKARRSRSCGNSERSPRARSTTGSRKTRKCASTRATRTLHRRAFLNSALRCGSRSTARWSPSPTTRRCSSRPGSRRATTSPSPTCTCNCLCDRLDERVSVLSTNALLVGRHRRHGARVFRVVLRAVPLCESEFGSQGLICFYNERVDLFVDGVAQTRPKTVFSTGTVLSLRILKRRGARCKILAALSPSRAAAEAATRPARSAPAATIDEVTAAGIRGRGGAGFPTGVKWRTVAANASPSSARRSS